jgi:hypothetical protein
MMRRVLSLMVLTLACGVPAASSAQGAPPGSYQRQCRDISMNGPYLTAWCQGSRRSGQSTLNVQSCGTDIGVDPDGGLTCGAPGAGQPAYAPPSDRRPYPDDGRRYDNDRGYDQRDRGYDDRDRRDDGRPRYDDGYRRYHGDRGPVATLYEGPGFRGRSVDVYGETSNLANTGLNDRVGSIRLGRRSGAWEVCKDSRFRGRCITIDRDVRDTNEIGMGSAISSLRPAW